MYFSLLLQLDKLCNNFEKFVLHSCQGQYLVYSAQGRSRPPSPHPTCHPPTVGTAVPIHTSRHPSQLMSIRGEPRRPPNPTGIPDCIPTACTPNTIQQTPNQYFYLSILRAVPSKATLTFFLGRTWSWILRGRKSTFSQFLSHPKI